jgi:hypothetical protein
MSNKSLSLTIRTAALLAFACALSSQASETNAVSANEITLTLNNLTNHSVLSKLREISGTVSSPKIPVQGVLIRLHDLESGGSWDWEQASWTEDLDGAQERLALADNSTFKTPLPRLHSGRYDIYVQAVLSSKARTGTFDSPVVIRQSFVIDSRTPGINFFPLHDQQTVFDFSDIGGEIDKTSEIRLSISQVNEITELSSYWNGASWQTNSADPQIKLRVSSSGDFWFPSAETRLPKASDISPGMYLISVSAIDRAGNEGRAAITVIKLGPTLSLKR